jgi:hypothetical protein
LEVATQLDNFVHGGLPRQCWNGRRAIFGLQSKHDEIDDTSEAAAGHVPA